MKYLLTLILCFCLFSKTGLSSESIPLLNIGKIDGESSKEMSIVTIRFDKKPEFKVVDLQDHKSFMQLNIPNSIAIDSGKFIDVKSPIIKKIGIFQLDDTTSSIRIFLTEDAAIVKKASDTEVLNNRLVITTNHKALQNLISAIPLKKDIKQLSEPAASNVVTRDTINQIEAVSGLGSTNQFDLNSKLYTIGAFLGVMLLLLLAVLSVKPLMEKRKKAMHGENYTPMKLLGDLAISQKQKLSLVQIGSEQILISVTPENINFIQKIGSSKPKPELPDAIKDAFKNSYIPQRESSPRQLSSQETRSEKKSSPTMEPVNTVSENVSTNDRFNDILNEDISFKEESKNKQGNRINFKIDDDGIENVGVKEDTSKSIEDVTKIIRDKLKNLPNF